MKEMFEQVIGIIEKSQGVRETIEKELKQYYDINKKTIEDAQKNISQQMEEMMKSVPNPGNIAEIMQRMFQLMADMVGEENFKKIMEFQNKYPFLKEVFQKFIPQH